MSFIKRTLKKIFMPPEYRGFIGEQRLANKINWNNICGYEGKLLRNLYIPRANGDLTEIDLLYITQKGLFIIESKNYTGYIFGNTHNAKWTATLYGGKDWLGRKKVEKYHFFNPIWQNDIHIKYLYEYLGKQFPTFSIISFSNHCELKNIPSNYSNVFICQQHSLSKIIHQIWNTAPDCLTQEQINVLFEKLSPLTNQSRSTKHQHIENIQTKINSVEICPRCKGKLVIRTAKKGAHAGTQFYGCSNYPMCKFTKPL